jgi:predicted ATPase
VRELPAGTVTFLFTDIEGSTKLLHELGDDYANALAEHRRVLREAFQRHDGIEVDTQGDAFFVAFARAADALSAAREGQAGLDGPIRVRMGVHTGEPLVTDEGYVGIDVHRAARIAAVGHGGQVLVSQSTRELVSDDLLDLGEHRLKDLTAPERIYQLGGGEFPPLKSLNQSNLPEQPTPFVGREKELAEVLGLAGDPKIRLLTLTGPGGSGKTRLAVQAAAELVDEHDHGVWWAGLQAVRDPERVLPSIAEALGAQGDPVEHIGDRRMLLVLDNLEQIVEAAPALGQLLARCPNLKLIATSREPLRLGAEREYAVPPFVEQEGVGFFLGRARAVRADFEPDDAVREICNRLDQLPLALELAAARVRALSSAQILERLEQRLPLLTGGARDAPERQRTLRSTIAWSYELLSAEEQQAFRQLGVFAGGWSLEAAEQVAGADLDLLQSLLEKSLIRFDGERYSMLETIREFALESLQETGELEETRRRHFDFFFALAVAADTSAEGGYGRQPQLLLPEGENLRAALDAALLSGQRDRATELMILLENFWVTTNPFEGARRFEEIISPDLPDRLRARALRCQAGSLWMSGRYERSHQLNKESLALFRSLGDDEGVGVLLHRLGISTMNLGDRDEAKQLLDESLRFFRKAGSARGESEVIGAYGYLLMMEDEPAQAAEHFVQAEEQAAEIGFTWWQIGMLQGLSECYLQLGRLDEGEAAGRKQLLLSRKIGERQSSVYGLVFLAWAASQRKDAARAGLLWGAVEAEEKRAPIGQWELERDLYAGRVLVADGPEFRRAREEGRRLSLERAVEEVLGGGGSPAGA